MTAGQIFFNVDIVKCIKIYWWARSKE